MSNTTTDNFWQAWAMPVADPATIFYRLYYDNNGNPVCYTMEDLPGTYIEIDQATYALSLPNVRVIDKKIIVIKKSATVTKLQPSATGTICDPQDVCVVVTVDQPHTCWSIKTHEID